MGGLGTASQVDLLFVPQPLVPHFPRLLLVWAIVRVRKRECVREEESEVNKRERVRERESHMYVYTRARTHTNEHSAGKKKNSEVMSHKTELLLVGLFSS